MTPNVFDGHALDLPRFARRQHRSAVEIIHAHEKNVTEPCKVSPALLQLATLTSTLMGFWGGLAQGHQVGAPIPLFPRKDLPAK